MLISPVTTEIVAPITRFRPPGHKGPYAEEIAESRIGLQTGMDGARNVTRMFRVYTNSPGDNPVQTITTLSNRYGGVTTGSPFPVTGGWGDGSFVLFNFTIIDHWTGTNVWILQANYVPSYVASVQRELWTFRVQSSLETERIYTDLNGKGIGPPKYNYAGASGPFVTKNLNSDKPEQRLSLAGGGTTLGDATARDLPRFQHGADRPRRTSLVSISKTITTLSPYMAALRSAFTNAKAVNEDTVTIDTVSGTFNLVDASGPRGTVMFQDVLCDPVPNPAGGSEPSYRITINLKHDPGYWVRYGSDDERWFAPFQEHRAHMHRWDDGNESPILFDGKPIVESWYVNGATSLTDIIGGFR